MHPCLPAAARVFDRADMLDPRRFFTHLADIGPSAILFSSPHSAHSAFSARNFFHPLFVAPPRLAILAPMTLQANGKLSWWLIGLVSTIVLGLAS